MYDLARCQAPVALLFLLPCTCISLLKETLAATLPQLPLRSLSLSWIEPTAEVLSALKHCPDLRRLDLSGWGRVLSDEGEPRISSHISCSWSPYEPPIVSSMYYVSRPCVGFYLLVMISHIFSLFPALISILQACQFRLTVLDIRYVV